MLSGFFDPHMHLGDAFSISSIRKIGPRRKDRDGNFKRSIYLEGDGEKILYASDVESLLKRPTQLMPVEPGTMLLHLYDDVSEVDATPMIAWALSLDGHVRPVTPAGVDDDTEEPDQGWFVQMPDGKVFAVDGVFDRGAFDSKEELLAYHQAARAKSRSEDQQ